MAPNFEGKELFVDYDKTIQIFTNLIYNALKFTSEGYIEISEREVGDFIEFAVISMKFF